MHAVVNARISLLATTRGSVPRTAPSHEEHLQVTRGEATLFEEVLV